MMRYKKMQKYIKKKYIDSYRLIEKDIKDLEECKGKTVAGDINSFLKSKNKVSRVVENTAISNIIIDEKIDILLKWKSIIDTVIEEFKMEDEEVIGKILDYKFFTSFPETTIAELCYVDVKKVSKTIKDFITEVMLIALDQRLVTLKMIEE